MTPNIFRQVELATGHTLTHRTDALDARAIEVCKLLLPKGGKIVWHEPFFVRVDAPVLEVLRGKERLVLAGMGNGHDEVWEVMAGLQARLCTAPRGSWLATMNLPGRQYISSADGRWLDDFLVFMAAALILDARQRQRAAG